MNWFRAKVEDHGGGNYQTMLNDALRTYTERMGLASASDV